MIPEIRRAEDNSWHLSMDDVGMYVRLHAHMPGVVIPTSDAIDIARAILEMTDDG